MISLIANDADVEYLDETGEVVVSLDDVAADSINTEEVFELIDSELYLEWLGIKNDCQFSEAEEELIDVRNDISELVAILKGVTEELEELS